MSFLRTDPPQWDSCLETLQRIPLTESASQGTFVSRTYSEAILPVSSVLDANILLSPSVPGDDVRERVTSAKAAYEGDNSALGTLLETYPPSMVVDELLKAVGLIMDHLKFDLRGQRACHQEQEVRPYAPSLHQHQQATLGLVASCNCGVQSFLIVIICWFIVIIL